LHERRGDIELLALYFLARYNQQRHRNVLLTKEALLRLEGHDWPGNVRQLENLIERLVIMSDAESISAGEIERILGAETAITLDKLNREGPTAEAFKPYKKVNVEERIAIIEALRAAGGNKTHAARLLGMSIRQLYYRLDKLNIG
jgi:Nif-specific regulatory protein